MNRITQILSLGLVCTQLAGCGKGSAGKNEPSANARAEQKTLQGTLTQNTQDALSGEYTDPCDQAQAEQRLEITAALDERQKELVTYTPTKPLRAGFRQVPLGRTYIRENDGSLSIDPKPGWYETKRGWQPLYQKFLKIKNTPTQKDWQDWADLDEDARSIIVDDQFRMIDGANLFLDKDSGQRLSVLTSAFTACIDDPLCVRPALDQANQDFMAANPYYRDYLKQVNEEKDTVKLRKIMARQQGDLASDYKRYAFLKNATISHMTTGELTVPLDAGDLVGAETQLARYIESVWSSPDLHIKINWTNSGDKLAPFRFFIGEEVNERSFVNFKKRQIHLFANESQKVVAHEFGHALGFKDHYYTVWKPESCSYVIQSREDDLMADHETGSVTSEEWAELKKQYP